MEERKISMLYVGDKSVVTSIQRQNYRKVGIHTVFSESLLEVEKALAAQAFDVIVINTNSLGFDASRLVEFLASETDQKLPIIATGIPSSHNSERLYLEKGARLFVEQPLPLSSFSEQVYTLLGHKVRKCKRTSGPCLGSIFCVEERAMIECDIENLSEGGAKIRAPLALSQTKGTFKLLLKGQKNPVEVFGELSPIKKRVKDADAFFYRVKFINILDKDLEIMRRIIAEDEESALEATFY